MLGRKEKVITSEKHTLFSSELGKKLFKRVCDFIDRYGMRPKLLDGVLVGFSGGADSVFLLEFLKEYKQVHALDFKMLAVHVNHSIRGDEALRDEEFSRDFANNLGIEFLSKKVDAVVFAKEHRESLEEAARNLRYGVFSDIIQSRNDIATIAVAHNADDNFETVLFNMMRGTGLRGLCGITPVRDNIVRPILPISKSEILDFLKESRLDFVNDSTNFSTEYTRNYIRHELVPRFSRLSASPELSAFALSETLRQDNSFIEEYARKFISENSSLGKIPSEKLLSLHGSVLARVLFYLAEPYGISLERVHIQSITKLLPKGNFRVSLPRGYDFVSESGTAYVEYLQESHEFCYNLQLGENYFENFDDIIVVSEKKVENSFSNVYKIAIQVSFNFDIMSDGLRIRNKMDGDSYRFGGMTRKLKKLFNDKEIPPSRRKDVPVFCDKQGIVYVPGLPVREGAEGKSLYVAICTPCKLNSEKKRSFYTLS